MPGFCVYASEQAKLSIGQVFHDKLSGTATRYLPGDAGKMMYAYKVSRNRGGEDTCLELSGDDCPRLTFGSDTLSWASVPVNISSLRSAIRVGPVSWRISMTA